MQAWSYPLRSRYIGAWAPDLRSLRSNASWALYWTLLTNPELWGERDALRNETDLSPRMYRKARTALIDGGLLTDGGQVIAVPASSHLSLDMSSADRRLTLAWSLYGPQSRRDRSRVTGIDYNSKSLSRAPYGPAPDRALALEWIGRTCARGRQWARNRDLEAGTATILAWRPVWHLFQRRLNKSNAWLVDVLRNRNLPHLRDVDHLADWIFQPVQLPLFRDALPVQADQNLTRGGPKPDSRADQNLTRGGPKPDGFTALVNGSVNRLPVKDGEESSAGESSASGGTVFSRDYLRRLGLSDRQIEYQLQQGDA